MKNRMTLWIILLISCLFFPYELLAQINPERVLNRSRQRAERQVERRVERRIDRGVDKALDRVEEAVDGTGRKDDSGADEGASEGGQPSDKAAVEEAPPHTTPSLVWSQFDFVPGDEIIFEDQLENEQNGEFPSKWDLVSGTIENAQFGDDNVIFFRRTSSRQGIVPLIKENQNDYLPEAFTIEFDAWFEADVHNQTYQVYFYDMKNQRRVMNDLRIYINKASYGGSEGIYPGVRRGHIGDEARWRRVSISFNQRSLKVYLDDVRLLNIPNITDNPTGVTLAGMNQQSNRQSFIKNIRIAKGAVPLYDRYLTDGRIITNGIRFDVNRATIRPESSGVINEIVKLMNDHPELKFSVEGHTDSDGSAEHNQRLSEARAKAVMDRMVELGIDPSRLTSTGHGQTKPIADNNTPEGKAQNRRVEFVRI